MNRKQIPLLQFLVALCFFLGFPYILLSVNAFTGSDFLYKDKPEALHVREYFVPQTPEDVKDLPAEFRKYKDLPKFLSSSDNGDRVVVFYAAWCG